MTVNRWIVVAVLLSGATALQARVIHVDGDGGGDVFTIQKGLDMAADGDTVLVAPGEYHEQYISFLGKNICLTSDGGPAAVKVIGNGAGQVFELTSGEGPGSVLDGFTVTNGWFGVWSTDSARIMNNVFVSNSVAGVLVNEGGASLITGNIIALDSGGAIEVNSYSSPTIEGNLIYGNGGSGIYSSNSTPVIRDNVILDNAAGITAPGRSVVTGNVIAGNHYGVQSSRTVTNNLLVGNETGISNGSWPDPIRRNNVIVGGERGISLDFVTHPVTLENNVIVDCATGIYATTSSSSDPHIVRNNVIADCDRGVYCFYPGVLMDLTYNDLWNNRLADYVDCTPGEGSISVAPGFADPGRNHYALEPASPLIDRGAPSIVDPDSTRSDIGAYGGPDAITLALTLVPRDTILTRGADSLLYDLILSNTTALTRSVRAWTKLILASRRPYPGNPVRGPVSLRLGPHETISTPVTLALPIPPDAPAGIYEYRVNAAVPPGEIRTRRRFYFQVRP